MPQNVNPQVVDAVATTSTATVGQATSMAMAMFFQSESQAFAMGMQNAVVAQRGSQQLGEALVATACALMMATLEPPAAK